MSIRYLSNLCLAVVGAFAVVASFAFSADTYAWLLLGSGAVAVAIGSGAVAVGIGLATAGVAVGSLMTVTGVAMPAPIPALIGPPLALWSSVPLLARRLSPRAAVNLP